jgi:integrase
MAANYRPPKNAVTLAVALEHYAADVARRHNTHTLSKPQFDRIGYAMNELETHFGSQEPLANLGTERLQDFLKRTTRGKGGPEYSNKTWINRRGYLTAFFEYCRQEGYLDHNPASGIRNYRKKQLRKAPPTILDLSVAVELMSYLEDFEGGKLVPFYALCLFAGIRPDWDNGEITKIRPEHFNLRRGELKMPAGITKTGKPRVMVLQPNLRKWLRAYPIKTRPIIFRGFESRHLKVRKKFKLGHNVLRHTCCSMLVAKFRSVGDTSLQAGNSEGVMWSNYLNLVRREVAEKFWAIEPRAGSPKTS